MQVTVQKLSPVLVEFDVQIDATRVTAELEKSYTTVSRGAKIKGFRPGHAPRQVLSQVFGARIASEVAKRLVDETFPDAVAEQKVQPINEPSFEADRVVAAQPFSYKARFEVLPEVAEVNWEGLLAKRPKVEVTDEQIAEQLEKIRRQHATLEPITEARALAAGDVITMDYSIEVNGKTVPDAGSTGFVTELGSGRLLPDLEKGILGQQVGQTICIPMEMPKNHKNKKLKGKLATFRIVVKEAKVRVLPNADDEFAKDIGEFETLEALRTHIRGEVEKAQKEQGENVVAEQLVVALVKANTLVVPPSLVMQQMRITEQEIIQRARSMGSAPQSLGEELQAEVRADSEMKVRAGLLMAEIAKRNQIRIGDKEIEDALTELAAQAGQQVARLRAEYREQRKREMLIGMILENKVLELIQSKATIEEA
jgi:trigger factor